MYHTLCGERASTAATVAAAAVASSVQAVIVGRSGRPCALSGLVAYQVRLLLLLLLLLVCALFDSAPCVVVYVCVVEAFGCAALCDFAPFSVLGMY